MTSSFDCSAPLEAACTCSDVIKVAPSIRSSLPSPRCFFKVKSRSLVDLSSLVSLCNLVLLKVFSGVVWTITVRTYLQGPRLW